MASGGELARQSAMSIPSGALGAYIHFPFCVRKCRYCDFNSCAASYKEREQYLAALETEIATKAARLSASDTETPHAIQRPITTIYLGGGTPTVYEAREIIGVLQRLRDSFDIAPDAEITCEANPGTIARRSLAALREAGINRLSLGVQSFRDEELEFLGRIHSAAGAEKAFRDAREAGFTNISLDLMRALPGQTLDEWTVSLERALSLAPEHLSTYGLTIEPETPLAHEVEAGRLEPCDENTQVAMFEFTREFVLRAGYEHYEISNYARRADAAPDGPSPYRCRHNETYWRNGEYLGFGAGAWSYLTGLRARNVNSFQKYTAAVTAGFDATVERDQPDAETALGETIMLNLRMADGVDYAELAPRFGPDAAARFDRQVSELVGAGLMAADSEGFRLTPAGYLLQSEIAQRFLR
jgi:oxygen-independent coproporphyrinogen III oxidase